MKGKNLYVGSLSHSVTSDELGELFADYGDVLYSQLINTKFNFIRRGEHHLQDIYRELKLKFPELCDDNILCSEICSQGGGNPEWQHRVRAALQSLKSKDGLVSKSGRHGYWFFS